MQMSIDNSKTGVLLKKKNPQVHINIYIYMHQHFAECEKEIMVGRLITITIISMFQGLFFRQINNTEHGSRTLRVKSSRRYAIFNLYWQNSASII